MYDELVKSLRETQERIRSKPDILMYVPPYQLTAAADAIEALSKELMDLKMLTCCCCEPPKEDDK